MKEKPHKLYDLTISDDGIRFRHDNPDPLSAEQKYTVILTAMWLAAAIIAIALIASVVR